MKKESTNILKKLTRNIESENKNKLTLFAFIRKKK